MSADAVGALHLTEAWVQDAREAAREAAQEAAREAQQAAREAQQEAREAVRRAVEEARAAQGGGGGQGGVVDIAPAPSQVHVMPDGRVVVGHTTVDGSEMITTTSGTYVPPQPPVTPEMIRDISYAFFAMIAFIAVGLPLVRLLGRWLNQRPAPAALPPDLGQRLTGIEQAVEAVAIEVERISEGQRFTSRLLSDLRTTPQLERVSDQRG